jgi:anti-sigma regulatory factor (Ser/Thr protein kinase)
MVLPSDGSAARAARDQVTAICADWPAPAGDAAVLLTSEVVTNAVLHGHGDVTLLLRRRTDWLRVEVGDQSDRLPPRVPERDEGRGAAGQWGLVLVAMLADDWGAKRHGDGPGKIVWFELTAPHVELLWAGHDAAG